MQSLLAVVGFALAFLLSQGCNRYETVFPPAPKCDTIEPFLPIHVEAVDSPGIVGLIVNKNERPLAGVFVTAGNRGVSTSDTSGHFRMLKYDTPTVVLRSGQIGYRRRFDTLVVPSGRGLNVIIPMAREVIYASCDFVVTGHLQRKPWWKWW